MPTELAPASGMTMSEHDWYNQVLVEVRDFLDQFEEHEIVAVYRDSEIIAALVGVLQTALWQVRMAHMIDQQVDLLNLLDSGPAVRSHAPA